MSFLSSGLKAVVRSRARKKSGFGKAIRSAVARRSKKKKSSGTVVRGGRRYRRRFER